VIVDPHPESEQHQSLTTYRGSTISWKDRVSNEGADTTGEDRSHHKREKTVSK